ncbi:MAG: serine kinase [Cyanobacteria bacterium J06600_6]
MANANISNLYREEDSIAFFETFQRGFKRAVASVGATNLYFNLGGRVVCLRFASPSLISHIAPAIAHLQTEPVEKPELTVCLWDSVSTNAPLPLLAQESLVLLRNEFWARLDTRMEIKNYNSDRIYSVFNFGSNVLSLLDTEENLALFWTEDVDLLPYWDRGSPLREIFNWWTSARNLQFVHAGAVGNSNGGVLLAGKGGSGKSSTALACLDSELVYASDDYCLIEAEPEPLVYSLYNTAKLKGQKDLERFPHLTPMINNLDRLGEEKAMIFIQEHFPEKIINQLPIKAILMPRVTGQLDTQVTLTNSMTALKALAPSTIFQLPRTGKSSFTLMSKLVRQVPCYFLELGTDIPQIPQCISNLLNEL